ncbi:phospholipid/cholesterol/gamma-HCH transport system substrate-binding protein [Marinobacter segnicrescens]|uniref:Phospholipid/cholesterol/gamma-HCH transport system substrate-binding protein n=1 Tax=Marinobacter segnicrescens TaxID=430453 RepID=A0A1H9Y8K8_9GAMM|nr:MlaD family protein [Marinobacter segnicrescens]SES65160.1 phospholipid/cholesterol/gamma-HCH transport system substrate-binding protein [Marinobacter segnicrescens]
MEPRAHHVLIGLFTVVTIAAILLFALWLGDSQGNREYTWYEIGFRQGVSGLSEGSPVQYSGIEVGNVAELRLDPENPSHVLALVRVYEDVPVRENTKASLSLANITGAMTIQLSGGTADSKILKGDRRNPPYIQAEPSQLSALMSNSESLFQRADDFLTNANQFLSEENADNLTAALENLRTASDSLVGERENLNRALVAVYEAAARAEQTFERYERLGNYLDELLEQEGQPMLASARSAAESLEQATIRIDTLVADNEGSVGQGLQSLGELAPVMQELETTLRNLRRLTQRLEEDPGKALLGQDPIQEVSP